MPQPVVQVGRGAGTLGGRLDRVFQHFSGRGNGDVYADWSYGDAFTIRTIALRGSGYRSLDDLERDAIATYDAMGADNLKEWITRRLSGEALRSLAVEAA